MINLEIASLDFYTKSIKVLGKRNKERIIPLSKTLMDQLQGYIQLRNEIESNTEYLFVTPSGKKMYPSLVYKIVKKYLSLVTTMTKRSPHVLRHLIRYTPIKRRSKFAINLKNFSVIAVCQLHRFIHIHHSINSKMFIASLTPRNKK